MSFLYSPVADLILVVWFHCMCMCVRYTHEFVDFVVRRFWRVAFEANYIKLTVAGPIGLMSSK